MLILDRLFPLIAAFLAVVSFAVMGSGCDGAADMRCCAAAMFLLSAVVALSDASGQALLQKQGILPSLAIHHHDIAGCRCFPEQEFVMLWSSYWLLPWMMLLQCGWQTVAGDVLLVGFAHDLEVVP